MAAVSAASRGSLPGPRGGGTVTATSTATPASTPSADPPVADAPSAAPTPSAKPSTTATARRTTAGIKDYLSSRPGRGAVAAVNLATGGSVTYRGTREFITASIVKVDILIALLIAAQADGRRLTGSERSLARSMITRSDNDAASTLWRAVGGADGLDRVNERLGLTGTQAGTGGYWGHTLTTASDQLRLLRVLAGSAGVLTEARRSYALDLMHDVVAGQRWGVSVAAADADDAALKNGWLATATDQGLWTVHSIGRVVLDGGDPALLAVLTRGSPSMEAGIATVQQLTRLAAAGL